MNIDTTLPETTGDTHIPAKVNWTGVILYIALTFGISWVIWLGLGALGVPFTIRTAIGMFGPAAAATLVRLVRHEGFGDAGLRLREKGKRGAGWMYLAAYLAPPVLIFAGIAVVLLVGYQQWAFSANLHAIGQQAINALRQQGQTARGLGADQLALISVLTQTALAFTIILPFNMIFTFGEEFGWRGYLLPRLVPLGGIPATLITGIIWGLWHAPLIILDGYNYPGYPWLGVLMMVVFTVSLGAVFAWLRFRSGSVWPSTLAHAAFNAQAGFALLFLTRANPLLGAPIGLLALIPTLAFAIWLAATGRLKPGTGATTVPVQSTPASY